MEISFETDAEETWSNGDVIVNFKENSSYKKTNANNQKDTAKLIIKRLREINTHSHDELSFITSISGI